jgi:hypothetical protein
MSENNKKVKQHCSTMWKIVSSRQLRAVSGSFRTRSNVLSSRRSFSAAAGAGGAHHNNASAHKETHAPTASHHDNHNEDHHDDHHDDHHHDPKDSNFFLQKE